MKRFSGLILLLSIGATASWGACTVDPNQIIQGGPWAFQLVAGDYAPAGTAAIGTFTALPNGVLQLTETTNSTGVIARGQQASGRYIVYSDCTGGELMFNANGVAMQLEFVYANNFQKMKLVSDELNSRNGGTIVLTGYAKRTTSVCPAGLGDPLNILNNTSWSFRTFPAFYPGGPSSSSVGIFNPIIVGGAGRLTGTETINNGSAGPITRGAQLSGRYIIYPDCSGGEIMLMNRGWPTPSLQLEFVFAGPNFSEMYMLNDALVGAQFADIASVPADGAQSFVRAPQPKLISIGGLQSLSVVAGEAEKF